MNKALSKLLELFKPGSLLFTHLDVFASADLPTLQDTFIFNISANFMIVGKTIIFTNFSHEIFSVSIGWC